MAGLQIYGAGRAGDGTNTNILMLGQALKDMGAWIFSILDEVYSNIQTRDSGFAVRAADRPVFNLDDEFDILQAFDVGAFVDIAQEGRIPPITRLKQGGAVISDPPPRLESPNAGHEIKLEKVQDILDGKRARVFGLPMGQLAKDQLGLYNAPRTLSPGVLAHLVGIPDEVIVKRFAKRYAGDAVAINEKALKIGRDYVRTPGTVKARMPPSAWKTTT